MDSLPIPQLRSSWVAALINAVLLFLLYYLFAFDGLLNIYKAQFDSLYFEQSQTQLKIWADIPRYYSSSESAWVYIHIQNESDHPVYDVETYLIADVDPSKVTFLMPNLYDQEVYSSGTLFKIIAPGSITTARVAFIAQADPVITKVLLIHTDDQSKEELYKQDPKEFVRVNESNLRTLQHSFLETILLPPWSNGFILALALFSAYLVRKGEEEVEPQPFTVLWWNWVAGTVYRSLIVLGTITGLIAVFLITNESTFVPILFIIVLGTMWSLELKMLSKGVSRSFTEKLSNGAFLIALIILVPASLTLLIQFLEFLDPLLFSLPTSLESGVKFTISVVAIIVIYQRVSKKPQTLDIWAYFFSTLGVLILVYMFLTHNREIDSYILWVMLVVIGLGTRAWRILLVNLSKKRAKHVNKEVSKRMG